MISPHIHVQEKWLIYGALKWDQDATKSILKRLTLITSSSDAILRRLSMDSKVKKMLNQFLNNETSGKDCLDGMQRVHSTMTRTPRRIITAPIKSPKPSTSFVTGHQDLSALQALISSLADHFYRVSTKSHTP